MGKTSDSTDSLLTLPVVLGVLVVIGGIAATVVSGLFVYRAHSVHVQTRRLQERLLADRQENLARLEQERSDLEIAADEAPHLTSLPQVPDEDSQEVTSATALDQGMTVTALKPGIRLQAQRPAHWDQAEIIDILEDHKVKVRWLSGEPGEAIIAAELVRAEPATQ
jgi:hypothetical protein